MDVVEQLRNLASEASIRSVPKLVQTAAAEGIKASRKQAEEALQKRVPAQVLGPPPRSSAQVVSEGPESRYAIDLIDFSQNTNKPGGLAYILVLMQVWSRKIWATPMKDKTWQSTNKALKKLLEEANPSPDQTHDLLKDAGNEFQRVSDVLPENWVERTKDPLDRQGIASLDKGIQTLKVILEDIIEEQGGDWTNHLAKAVSNYNRQYNSAVLGPPKDAENGQAREFLIDEENARRLASNAEIQKKRVEAVQKTGYFREATGAKRAFAQQYGPKLKAEGFDGAYVKGSDDQLHLLKRVLPVHAGSEEPKGKLIQPRQWKSQTLRDLAEDVHDALTGNPRLVSDMAVSLDLILEKMDARIKTKAFVKKFPDLFSLQGEGRQERVHALVLSGVRKPRVVVSKEQPRRQVRVVKPRDDNPPWEPEPGSTTTGGSSSSRDVPARARRPLTMFEALSYSYGKSPPASALKP